jgi:NAD(P)-dependent dehydrogenase (short-subunit alcohol dehydrogenase family)
MKIIRSSFVKRIEANRSQQPHPIFSHRRRLRHRSSRRLGGYLAYTRSKIPMDRLGTVEEAAALIAWLASRECSFSTGAVFDLSGGRATY